MNSFLKKRAVFLMMFAISYLVVGQNEHFDPEDQQFQMFAQNLADFVPTQSFEFELNPSEQQTLMFWPPPQAQLMRGLFYVTSQENGGLFVGCESDSQMQKTFYDKKIGVFNFAYPGTGDMKLIFKSQIHQLKVYASYQLVMKPKADDKMKKSSDDDNVVTYEKKMLEEVLQKFSKVQKSMSGQTIIMNSIVKSSVEDEKRILNEMKWKSTKAIIETIIVIFSGFLSIWMLKKQIKYGYQLII